MTSKTCDPECTGRCNKNRLRKDVQKASRGCDPRCTGRCSKKNAGTSLNPDIPSVHPDITSVQPDIYSLRPILKACDPRCIGTCSKNNGTSLHPDITSQVVEDLKSLEIEEPQLLKAQPDDLKSETLTETGVEQILPDGQIGYIILDLDGVILDTETVYSWVITDLVKQYDISQSEIQRIIDLQDEETSGKFCHDYNCPISPEDFMEEFQKTCIRHLGNTPLMPGIKELVKYFNENNYLVAVATTSNQEAFTLKTRNHLKFFKNFSHIVLGGSDPEVIERKPSPILYKVCASRFPSKPNLNSILVFEDAPEGIEAAKGAGMNVIWFPNKYMNRDDDRGAIAVLNSIKEFNPKQFGLLPLK